jgi:hypothetical protein
MLRMLITLITVSALSVAVASMGQPSVHTRTFHDPAYKISFDYPSSWQLTQKDREISTFHLDARSAPRNDSMRAVAAMPENPFPLSTFSGAYIYFSVTPHSSDSACAKQANPIPNPVAKPRASVASVKPSKITIGDISFTHGHDERSDICVIQRDEIYTTRHGGACYRFDLAINNFCGGQVSGVKDISDKELDQVRGTLEAILATVRFDPK